MKTYQVELINRNNTVVQVAEHQYILDAVEATGLRLPVGCRYGACITCAARLLEGEVEQPKAVALKPAQEAMGYFYSALLIPAQIANLKWELSAKRHCTAIPLKVGLRV